MKRTLLLWLCLVAGVMPAWSVRKLSGTSIGSTRGYDYSTGKTSTTKNLRGNALDGDLSTYFASGNTSKGWVGVDLGAPHVVTKVGWAPAGLPEGPMRTVLGIFEGANEADFSDAVPLYMITQQRAAGKMWYGDVPVTRAVRYVRYIGPANARCNIADIEFWGFSGKGSESRFYQCTNLPTVNIRTKDNVDPSDKVNEIVSHVTIVSQGGTRIEQYDGTTRLRGNASMTFPKKPYRIKFDEKHRILDAPAKAKKWTLINNYGDKTLLRNVLAFELSRRMGMGFTPWCQPVDVIFNGEYKGCYQLCDQVEVRKHRVDITEMDTTCTEGDALTGGYLIEIDKHAPEEPRHFTTSRNTPVTIKYPDDGDLLDVQYNYIKTYYQSFETALFKTSTWKDPDQGYRYYLNLPSFLRHFLVGELSGNTDTYWSTYMYKDRTESQFFVEPVWDFDLAFENDNRTYPICSRTDYIYRTVGSHAGNFPSIVDRIVMYDGGALADLREMWALARYDGRIDVVSLQAYVDSVATELYASQQLNFIRWPIMTTKVHQNPTIWGTYEAEVKNVKDYLERRIAWMDNKLRYPATIDAIPLLARDVMAEVHVWDGHVVVAGVPSGTPYQVYDMQGALVHQGRSGEASTALRRGTYLIRVERQTTKVIVP